MGYRLKEAQSLLRTRMDARLRDLGLTTAQYACLELLGRTPGSSNADLARGAFVTRQTMNTLLRTLEDRGLVTRAEHAPSGRALPTSLTPAGEAMRARAAARVEVVEKDMVSTLSAQQATALHEALGACIEALRDS